MSGEYKYRLISAEYPGFAKNSYRDDGDRYVRECGAYVLKRDMHHLVFTVSVDWDGAGSPPVGTVCEYLDMRCGVKRDWMCVTIQYMSDVTLVVRPTTVCDGKVEISQHPTTAQFRPIRTPEQIAAAERDEAITAMGEEVGNTYSVEEAITKLYDAGYRKQVTQ